MAGAGTIDSPEERRRREGEDSTELRPSDEAASDFSQVVVASASRPRPRDSEGRFVKKAMPAPSYGRKLAPGERSPALVASAARIDMRDRRSIENTKRRRQAWQSEAWAYVNEIGELSYTLSFLANLMSKLRLFAAVRPDPTKLPISVDHNDSGIDQKTAALATATLERLRSNQGGQSAIVRGISINLEVCGEVFLHGHEKQPGDSLDEEEIGEEEWNVRSVEELFVTGDRFVLRTFPGAGQGDPIPEDDMVIRLWEPSPQFSSLAHCAMRPILAEAEALLLLSREVRSSAKSRLSNGILLVPSEMSFGPIDPTRDGGDGEETDDPFDAELQESMITPIQEEGSASAVVPLTMRGPAEFLKEVRHLQLARPLDPDLEKRIEARVLRIARGLNMPTEVTTGFAATTFSNAATIKRSEFEDHIEPRATLVCDAITSGYFQWALVEAGVDRKIARTIFVWFDPSALIAQPDQAEKAGEAHKDMLISDAAYRHYLGYGEDDAPDDAERLVRLMLSSPRMDPFILAQLLQRTGLFPEIVIPGPSTGAYGEVESQSALPAPGAPDGAGSSSNGNGSGSPGIAPATAVDGAVASAVPGGAAWAHAGNGHEPAGSDAAGRWRVAGERQAAIDRDLRTRIRDALDVALRQALTRAGNRLRSKVQRAEGGAQSAAFRIANDGPPGLAAAALGPALVADSGLTDADLLAGAFEATVDDVMAWIEAAHQTATAITVKASGRAVPAALAEELAARHVASMERARVWLTDAMAALGAARMYDPNPKVTAGESDPTTMVPMSYPRVVMAIAGGGQPIQGGTLKADGTDGGAWVTVDGPVTDGSGGPVGGVAVGPDMLDLASGLGGMIEAWTWDYGTATRTPFGPHLDIDGTTVIDIEDPAWANSEGWPAAQCFPGDHTGCVPAGTLVSGPGVVAATSRWYQGPLIDMALASGDLLTVTPNHPVLTERGFVPAALLNEADHVVGCADPERAARTVDPDHHQVPAGIEEVFAALGVGDPPGGRSVPTSPEDFHCDGEGSEVHVVRANRLLCDRLYASLGEPVGQPALIRRLSEALGLSGCRGLLAAGLGVRSPSLGGVRPLDEGDALLVAKRGEENAAGLRGSAAGNTGPGETFGDGAPVDTKLGSEPVLGLASQVRLDRFVRDSETTVDSSQGQGLFATAPDASLLEFAAQRGIAYMETLGGGIAGLASQVRLDRIVELTRRDDAACHVYNLDTGAGWFIAGTVVVGNCTCDVIPVMTPAEDSSGFTAPDPGTATSDTSAADVIAVDQTPVDGSEA